MWTGGFFYLLSQDPNISQSELSKRLKISQPAVSARINKLKETGVIAHFLELRLRKPSCSWRRLIWLQLMRSVFLTFWMCRIYFNGFLTSGRYNLTVLLIGENIRSIMSCVDFHMRKNPFVKDMEFNVIVTPVRDFAVTIKPTLDKKKLTPCETECSQCILYVNDRCLGCPASIHYKGTLL